MNSSKVWGDNAEGGSAAAAEPRGSGRYVLGFLVTIGGLVVLIAGGLWGLNRLGEQRLNVARDELRKALDATDESVRQTHVRAAEQAVRAYHNVAVGKSPAGNMLLMAVLSLPDGSADEVRRDYDRRFLQSRMVLAQSETADLLLAARALQLAGDEASTNEALELALSRQDLRVETLRVAARVRYDQGRTDDVMSVCREWAKLAPDDPGPWRQMARVYLDRGFWPQLVEALQNQIERADKALSADPETDVIEARMQLLFALMQAGQTPEARAEFDRLQRDWPKRLQERPALAAQLLHLEGRTQEALDVAREILRGNPRDEQAQLLVGRLELSAGQFDAAIRTLNELVERSPNSSEGHYVLSQAYARRGDAEKSRTHKERYEHLHAVRLKIHKLEREAGRAPGNRALREQLAELYGSLGEAENAAFWRPK